MKFNSIDLAPLLSIGILILLDMIVDKSKTSADSSLDLDRGFFGRDTEQ